MCSKVLYDMPLPWKKTPTQIPDREREEQCGFPLQHRSSPWYMFIKEQRRKGSQVDLKITEVQGTGKRLKAKCIPLESSFVFFIY